MTRAAQGWIGKVALAVAAPLVFFGAVEGIVRLAWGPVEYPLPGVDEATHYLFFSLPERFNPLFELKEDEDGPHFHAVSKLYSGTSFFGRQQRFPAERGGDAVRVAFMGGSSVQGWPWRGDGVVFAEQVGQRLQERFPDRRVDVINAGVGTYSSFQLVDVAWQLTAFEPDVVVVYAGHNDRGYYFFNRAFLDRAGRGKERGGLIVWLNKLHFYRLARLKRDTWSGAAATAGAPSEELDVSTEQTFLPESERPDGGDRDAYVTRLQTWQELLPPMFDANLVQIVEELEASGATVVLASPASNLRDFPPAVSIPTESLSSSQLARLSEHVSGAEQLMLERGVGPRTMPGIVDDGQDMDAEHPWAPVAAEDALPLGDSAAVEACAEPLAELDRALKLSSSHARAWFLRGTCLLHSDPVEAKLAFERARDLSPAQAPHQRAGADLIRVVEGVARERSLPFVDMPAAFAAASDHGIPDGTLFVDNLHFSARGHAVAGQAIADVVAGLPVFVDGPAADRPRRTAQQTAERVAERSRNPRWGQDLEVAGAETPYSDDTGIYDSAQPSIEEIARRHREQGKPIPEAIREELAMIEAGLIPGEGDGDDDDSAPPVEPATANP